MSNPLFENPKVALGFAGVVVSIALVASVILQETTSNADTAQAVPSEQQAASPAPAPQQASPSYSSNAATGWAGDAGATDDWGAPSAASQSGGFAEIPESTNDAPVFGDHVSRSVSGGGADRSSGPTITSRAAPGAPEVQPPSSGSSPEIKIKG